MSVSGSPAPGRKRCPDCGEVKSLDEFPRNKRVKDGYAVYCKPCHNMRGRESKRRLYGGSRHYHLKRRYGIGANDFDRLLELQRGVCAVCGRPGPEHVDHDHETGEVRGILCFNCNGGLGQFGDDQDRLLGAIAYLDRTKADARELVAMAEERARELVGAASG